ncbi:hypothetical protein NCHU2750_11760 [Neorhizobium sp. NCHU2750]|nr:hypothetical protein NCHU2750_11760 [Neorhizobium sp. NCHU2750]
MYRLDRRKATIVFEVQKAKRTTFAGGVNLNCDQPYTEIAVMISDQMGTASQFNLKAIVWSS